MLGGEKLGDRQMVFISTYEKFQYLTLMQIQTFTKLSATET